jgi:hypothetical protein
VAVELRIGLRHLADDRTNVLFIGPPRPGPALRAGALCQHLEVARLWRSGR